MEIAMAAEPDIPALCALLRHLFLQEAEFAPDTAAQHRGLAQIIGHPEAGCILIAREQAEIVGMVNLLYTVSTALGAPVILLEDMVVAAAWRGKGVGTRLLEMAIAHARQNGFKRITLLTDHDNQQAHVFYRKHGFTASDMKPFRLLLE